MKHRLLYIIFILTVSLSASAQPGIRIGYTNSTHVLRTEQEKEKMNADGMTAGLTYDFRLHKDTYLRTGLMYSFQWYSDSYSQDVTIDPDMVSGINVNEHMIEHNVHLPIYLRQEIEMIPEILSFTMAVGPTICYGLSSETKITMFGAIDSDFRYDNYNGAMEYIYFPYDDAVKESMNEQFRETAMLQKRMDLSLGGSIGLNIIRQIELEIGYDLGLMNRYRDPKDMIYHRNRFRFTLSYIF